MNYAGMVDRRNAHPVQAPPKPQIRFQPCTGCQSSGSPMTQAPYLLVERKGLSSNLIQTSFIADGQFSYPQLLFDLSFRGRLIRHCCVNACALRTTSLMSCLNRSRSSSASPPPPNSMCCGSLISQSINIYPGPPRSVPLATS
jgi:hypothetical protein